jgi:hypothetical protein
MRGCGPFVPEGHPFAPMDLNRKRRLDGGLMILGCVAVPAASAVAHLTVKL